MDKPPVEAPTVAEVGLRTPAKAPANPATSYADREFDRFERIAVATESGGWRNPNLCSTELAEQIRVGGIPWENMERFELELDSEATNEA